MRSIKKPSVRLASGALIALTSALIVPAPTFAQTETGTSSGAMTPTVNRSEQRDANALPAQRAVRLVSCSVDRLETSLAPTTDGVVPDVPDTVLGIRVAFVNDARAAADAVGFLVSYNGQQRRIVDRGHFSPGIPIDHTLPAFAGIGFLNETPDSCTMANVHFEESTTRP